MCGHVRDAAADPLVQRIAAGAVQQFGGLAGGETNSAVPSACWWWAKHFIKFVHHETLLRQFLGEAGHLQGLISPEVLVRMDRPEGDCAIFSECVAAFLTALGVPYEFVTVAVNPSEPTVFSHVYVYAVMPDGSRMPLDASHGDYPGWQVPSSRVSRLQVWDASGRPVADRGSRFDGLHNYVLRGLGGGICDPTDTVNYDPVYCVANGGVPGSACTCVGGTCLEDGSSCAQSGPAPATFTPNAGYTACSDGSYVPSGSACPVGASASPGGAITAPSQNSAQWAAFSTALLKSGLTLAEINAIQPGTVVGPNGQILRQATGLAVPVGSASSITAALGGGSSSTLLLFAVVGVGLAFALGGKR